MFKTSPLAARIAAKFQEKKEVPKADGKGTSTVYTYGPRQVSNRDNEKADRIEKLRGKMSGLRTKYKKDMASADPKIRLTALAVALIDLTYERVGNEGSAKENGHYGVTTWQADHITLSDGSASISYTGKSGVKHKKTVKDEKVVAALRKALKGKGKGDRVLCEGEECQIRAPDVNEFLEEFGVTAKDIRGLHANEEMRSRLKSRRSAGPSLPTDRKKKDAILKKEFDAALGEAAQAVGHEPSTLKSQYLVPGLEESYLKDGSVMEKLNKKKATDEELYTLWKLLDDIDTAGDIAKGNEDVYRDLIHKTHTQRFQVLPEERVDDLYERFYKAASIPKMARLASSVGLDPWDSTRLPFGTLTFREAVEACCKSLATDKYVRTLYPKWALLIEKAASEWASAPGGQLLGYKVMRYDPERKEAVSGANSRIRLPLRKGLHRMPPPGIFLGASVTYVMDYYAVHDFNVLLTYSFSPQDVTSGDLEDREPEITVSQAKLVAWEAYDEDLRLVRTATKSEVEVEDEEAGRLVRKSPKKKPPRLDLQRGQVENREDKQDDPDAKQDRKDRSLNYKSSTSRVALRYFLARVSPTLSGKFKAEKPSSEIPQYFDSEEEAKAWEAEDSIEKDKPSDKKGPAKEDKPSDKKGPAKEDKPSGKKGPAKEDKPSDAAGDDNQPSDAAANEDADPLQQYLDAGLLEDQVDKVIDEVVSKRREKGLPESGDEAAVAEQLEKAVSQSKEDKLKSEKDKQTKQLQKEQKKLKQSLTPAEAKVLGSILKGFDEAQAQEFSASLETQRKSLAQNGPDDLEVLVSFVGSSKKNLKKMKGKPEELAQAMAAIEYFDKVVDDPTVETDPKVGPVPSGTSKITDSSKLKESRKAAVDRAHLAVGKYREMGAGDRKRHYEKLGREVKGLPEDSERRIHLEAIQRGIGVASALEDGDEARGVGSAISRLVQAAGKTGNTRRLMELGSVNSSEPVSPEDQQILRDVYSDLTDTEWAEVLGPDHPGAGLADLIGDPEQARYLTDDDIAAVKTQLIDLAVAEAAFLDPYATRELGPDATVADKAGVASGLRKDALPLKFDGSSKPGSKKQLAETIDWLKAFLKNLASSSNSKTSSKKAVGISLEAWEFRPWPKL